MFMPSFRGTKGKSQRIKCVTNLKNVGLAARIYASDKGGQMPGTFLLSNSVPVSNATALEYFAQLSIPTSILFCPDDQRRKPADSFTNISLKNISYFASLTANETLPVAFLSGDRNLQNHGQPVPEALTFALTTNALLRWTQQIHNGQSNIAIERRQRPAVE